MFSCNICEKISKYEISLRALNINNNLGNIPRGLKIGMKAGFLNITEDEKTVVIPFSLNIVGVEGVVKEEEEVAVRKESLENIDMNDEEVLFEINIIHELRLEFREKTKFEGKDLEVLKDYAYFMLEPTISELVSSLGAKIGIGGLRIPRNVRKFKDGNNN
ncbi:hypothetical protein [Clostridium perfringens]|uniref:hypothetical protein n=1 Tax=Clostridium perfringens TaxID=1502 RepID=UPI00189BD37B|nr:hypothetical protein [Clostridium perfringens]